MECINEEVENDLLGLMDRLEENQFNQEETIYKITEAFDKNCNLDYHLRDLMIVEDGCFMASSSWSDVIHKYDNSVLRCFLSSSVTEVVVAKPTEDNRLKAIIKFKDGCITIDEE